MLFLVGSLLLVGQTSSDTSFRSPDEMEEIVVTGERVPRSLRDTASSVDVSKSDRINSLSGADRLEQVLEMVPNVQLGTGGEGPAIRGQDTTGVLRDLPGFLGGSRPRTTLQVDGRPVSTNEFTFGAAPLWDIDTVEVFRTPQTTTQGRNSIAGAIFVNSKDPSYDWQSTARVIVGSYDLRQASAVLTGPFVSDQLAFRVAADLRRGRPSSKIIDLTRGADPNNDDYGLLRVKLLGEPDFWPSSRFELTYVHNESLAPQVEGIRPPFRDRRDPIDRYGTFGIKTDSLTAISELKLSDDLRASATFTAGSAHARRYAFPGLGEARNRIDDYSAETVLDWDPEGSQRLIAGISYLVTKLDQFIDLSAVIGLGEFNDRQSSLGMFGEWTVEPLPRTTISVGLRFQRDTQDRIGSAGTPALSVPLDYDETFTAWLPKLSLAHDFNDDFRAGVLVQRAYNPGGTTLRFDTARPENFDAESLWNYELFFRGSRGHRLNWSANIFYASMRDAQRARSIPYRVPGGATAFFAIISNVPRARTYGAELTAQWRPLDHLSARFALGLLNTKILQTVSEEDPALGKEFQRSPHLTAAASLDWYPLKYLQLSTQVRHNSRYFSDDLETPQLRTGRATIVDARASWQWNRFKLFGYVRNLFDEFELRSLSSATFAVAVDPREFGVGIEANF